MSVVFCKIFRKFLKMTNKTTLEIYSSVCWRGAAVKEQTIGGVLSTQLLSWAH